MSLRLRVTLLALAALVVGLLAAGVAVPILVERFLIDRVDEQLRGVAPGALRVVEGGGLGGLPAVPPPNAPAGTDGPDAPPGPPDLAPVFVWHWLPDGTGTGSFLDGRGPNAPVLPATPEADPGELFNAPGGESGRFRVLVTASPGNPGETFAVALSLDEVDATMRRVITIEVITVAAAVVGVALLTWWLVGLALRPLRRMEATAQAIAEQGEPGQGQRIEQASPRTELGRLGTTLNTMLDRIDDSFAAQRASESRLRRFAADASHELRTPLTSIRGYAELYRRGGDDREQVGRSMDRIEEEASRMSSLVEDLLTLTRLDEGRPLDLQPVDLAELAAKAVDDARVADPSRVLTVEASGPVTVEGDLHRLMQVLVNLLSNARLHTPPGTPVEITVRAGGPNAILEVIDHGPGLTPGQAAQVFDRFYRADPSRSRAQGGSGLGLAIVDAVVRAHGGQPSVKATRGGGATFQVELPSAG